MNELTIKQLQFLKEQNIHLKYVFNAEGLSKSEYSLIMKDLNMLIAFNVTPCSLKGHTMRTSSGHCCQCNTASIAFLKRHYSAGIVYIAGSKHGNLVKIGFTKAVKMRNESLNNSKYAGYNDWVILFALKSNNAGRIETRANSLLRDYAFSNDYHHDNHWQDSRETYHCAYSKAKEFVEKAYTMENSQVEIELNSMTDKYEFRNLKKI